MAEPFEITTDLISFYSEYSVVMMPYVFKFSIAYIHVYNDEKSPGP